MNTNPTTKSQSCFTVSGLVIASFIFFVCLAWIGLTSAIDQASFPNGKPDFKALEKQGGALVAAIEDYRAKRGEYPVSLEAAGISTPQTRWGPWKYQRLSIKSDFELKVGDYGQHFFVLWWRPGQGWYRDT